MACAFFAGAQDQMQGTLSLMNQASASFKGLTADVVKTHYEKVVNDTDVAKGTMVVRKVKPKEFQILYTETEPDPQQIEYRGHTGTLYNPKTNTYRDRTDKEWGDAISQLMVLGFGSSSAELQEGYTITGSTADTVAGRRATRLDLKPKKPDTKFQIVRVELWISDETGIAIQQKLYQLNGSWDLVTYSNMKLRPGITDSEVKLKLPPGAKQVK